MPSCHRTAPHDLLPRGRQRPSQRIHAVPAAPRSPSRRDRSPAGTRALPARSNGTAPRRAPRGSPAALQRPAAQPGPQPQRPGTAHDRTPRPRFPGGLGRPAASRPLRASSRHHRSGGPPASSRRLPRSACRPSGVRRLVCQPSKRRRTAHPAPGPGETGPPRRGPPRGLAPAPRSSAAAQPAPRCPRRTRPAPRLPLVCQQRPGPGRALVGPPPGSPRPRCPLVAARRPGHSQRSRASDHPRRRTPPPHRALGGGRPRQQLRPHRGAAPKDGHRARRPPRPGPGQRSPRRPDRPLPELGRLLRPAPQPRCPRRSGGRHPAAPGPAQPGQHRPDHGHPRPAGGAHPGARQPLGPGAHPGPAVPERPFWPARWRRTRWPCPPPGSGARRPAGASRGADQPRGRQGGAAALRPQARCQAAPLRLELVFPLPAPAPPGAD